MFYLNNARLFHPVNEKRIYLGAAQNQYPAYYSAYNSDPSKE